MKKFFPPLQWIKGYNTNFFGNDTIAGLTLTAYAIPVSLAYASLAGLPPQFGIFGYVLGGLFYALLGTGRQLAIGPTSAISMLVGVTLSNLSNGDTQRWIELASLTAFVFAIICFIAYIIRLSTLINFISETVLVGFKAGAAITIASTQLPKLFGLHGGGHHFLERCSVFAQQVHETNYYVLIFGLIGFVLILLGSKLFPGKPVAIVVVIISILVMSFTNIQSYGFKTVGIIPAGLPKFEIPKLNWADIESVLSLAFACFLLAYIESVSAAKALAQKNNYEIDARQEVLALGLSNLAVAFGGAYPVSGGLSQSVVNEKAGAKTPIAIVMASVFMGACLLFFTGLLKNLPTVILASIVLYAIIGLVDIKELNRMRKKNHFDFFVAIFALVSVLVFGILYGVLIAALMSLILILRIVSLPHIAFLGRIPGTDRFTDIKRHPDNELIKGILLFRVEAPLVYFNVANVYHKVWQHIENDKSLKIVIFDLSTSAYIDSSGARMIKKLYLNCEAKGLMLKVAEAHSEVRDILRFEDVEHLLGHVSRRDSLHDVVAHCISEVEMQGKHKFERWTAD